MSSALSVLMILTSASGVAEARKKKPKPGPPADLPGHVNYLIRQVYGLPLDEAQPTTDKIQSLVLSRLDAWIQNRHPSFVEVRRQLERSFSELRYPFYARCSAFAAPWKGSQIIGAGYSVGWSDYDRVNVVALYESSAGQTRRVALTHFVPRTNLNYIVLPSGSAGNFRFFVWGTRLGKAQPRLTAILYSFDGRTLVPLWEKKDVYDGKIAVKNNRLTLTYLNESEYVAAVGQNSLPPRHEAVYKLTSGGLKLVAERDIPF
jgi:hypothetical protein